MKSYWQAYYRQECPKLADYCGEWLFVDHLGYKHTWARRRSRWAARPRESTQPGFAAAGEALAALRGAAVTEWQVDYAGGTLTFQLLPPGSETPHTLRLKQVQGLYFTHGSGGKKQFRGLPRTELTLGSIRACDGLADATVYTRGEMLTGFEPNVCIQLGKSTLLARAHLLRLDRQVYEWKRRPGARASLWRADSVENRYTLVALPQESAPARPLPWPHREDGRGATPPPYFLLCAVASLCALVLLTLLVSVGGIHTARGGAYFPWLLVSVAVIAATWVLNFRQRKQVARPFFWGTLLLPTLPGSVVLLLAWASTW